jgi:hypothetical protein
MAAMIATTNPPGDTHADVPIWRDWGAMIAVVRDGDCGWPVDAEPSQTTQGAGAQDC